MIHTVFLLLLLDCYSIERTHFPNEMKWSDSRSQPAFVLYYMWNIVHISCVMDDIDATIIVQIVYFFYSILVSIIRNQHRPHSGDNVRATVANAQIEHLNECFRSN